MLIFHVLDCLPVFFIIPNSILALFSNIWPIKSISGVAELLSGSWSLVVPWSSVPSVGNRSRLRSRTRRFATRRRHPSFANNNNNKNLIQLPFHGIFVSWIVDKNDFVLISDSSTLLLSWAKKIPPKSAEKTKLFRSFFEEKTEFWRNKEWRRKKMWKCVAKSDKIWQELSQHFEFDTFKKLSEKRSEANGFVYIFGLVNYFDRGENFSDKIN